MFEIALLPEYHPMYKKGNKIHMCINNRREFFLTVREFSLAMEVVNELYETLGKANEEVEQRD